MAGKINSIFLILLFLLIGKNSVAQNLVPNPSFEYYTSCPQNSGGAGDFEFADPWLRSSGSPDYYNICSGFETGLSVPINSVGSMLAKTGDAYAGIYVFNSTLPPFPPEFSTAPNGREYISVKLIHGLELGKRYFVRFFVSLADVSGYAVRSLGVYFSNQLITSLPGYISQTPQVSNKLNFPIADKESWVAIEDTITALGVEEYLMIGNFLHDTLCDTLFIGNQDTWNYASYYYIDDVLVVDVDSLESLTTDIKAPKEEGLTSRVKVFPNPTYNILHAYFNTSDNLKSYDLSLYSLDGRQIEKLSNLSSGTTYSFDLSNYASGLYFLQLKSNNQLISSHKFIKL